MNRRQSLLLAGAGLAGFGLLGTGATLRLHRQPRRNPYLSDTHLAGLSQASLPRPRVLFIGNSMVLRNDLPAVVQRLARAADVALTTATAAADGARLIESVRISGLTPVLTKGWDAIVVQDFTKTPLRGIDRWASAQAISNIARAAAPAPLLLYPPWPAAAGTGVYRAPGFLTTRPANPEDYAARTMAFYNSLGHAVAPVPDAWLAATRAGHQLYADDGHHPNPAGTQLVANILWDSLKDLMYSVSS